MPDYLNDAADIMKRAADELREIAPEVDCRPDCRCCWCEAIRQADERAKAFRDEIAERDGFHERPLPRRRVG